MSSRHLVILGIAALILGHRPPCQGESPPIGEESIALHPQTALDPNNILVSVQHSVREFTPAGVRVQTIPFTFGGRDYPGTEDLRGIAVDQYGWIDSFNGTFFPFMSRYSPATGAFVHKTFPGLSSCGCVGTGGLAAYGNFVFAADMNTNYAGPTGIVRFDLARGTAARFLDGTEFRDLSIGVDGKLYALTYSSADIFVYDPLTMQLLRHITKPPKLSWMLSVAADGAGHVFVSGTDGTISRLDSSGIVQATQKVGYPRIQDLDVDEGGRLIASEWGGNIIVGDTSLTNGFTTFLAADSPGGAQEIHVSFARPAPLPIGVVPPPTPTPSPNPLPSPTHDIVVALGHVVGGISNREENSIRQFTPEGTLLRKARFNYNNGSYPITEGLRDIVIDQNGLITAFNGTFSPVLTRFSWICGSFEHRSFPGWSLVNNVTSGGLGIFQNFIFANDMNTAAPGTASGVVRFDTSTNTTVRFLSGSAFNSVTVGLDGKLYTSLGSALDVYDPVTMQFLRRVTFQSGAYLIAKIAVDASGRIFGFDNYGTVFRLSNTGALEASTATGFPFLRDIAIDETGRLALPQEDGWVVLGDTTLENFTSFRAVDDHNTWFLHVAFAPLTTPAWMQLENVVSEKVHGTAGTFALNLPITGPRVVESRSGGAGGNHTMVFTFAQALVQVGSICSNVGSVTSGMIDSNDPRRFVVNLSGVSDASYLLVTLNDVSGSNGDHSETVSQEMGLLVGDVTGLDGSVNSADVTVIRAQSGNTVTNSNFRADFNLDGVINTGDTVLVKANSGTSLPTYP